MLGRVERTECLLRDALLRDCWSDLTAIVGVFEREGAMTALFTLAMSEETLRRDIVLHEYLGFRKLKGSYNVEIAQVGFSDETTVADVNQTWCEWYHRRDLMDIEIRERSQLLSAFIDVKVAFSLRECENIEENWRLRLTLDEFRTREKIIGGWSEIELVCLQSTNKMHFPQSEPCRRLRILSAEREKRFRFALFFIGLRLQWTEEWGRLQMMSAEAHLRRFVKIWFSVVIQEQDEWNDLQYILEPFLRDNDEARRAEEERMCRVRNKMMWLEYLRDRELERKDEIERFRDEFTLFHKVGQMKDILETQNRYLDLALTQSEKSPSPRRLGFGGEVIQRTELVSLGSSASPAGVFKRSGASESPSPHTLSRAFSSDVARLARMGIQQSQSYQTRLQSFESYLHEAEGSLWADRSTPWTGDPSRRDQSPFESSPRCLVNGPASHVYSKFGDGSPASLRAARPPLVVGLPSTPASERGASTHSSIVF